jgi:hypothetical protein
MAWLFLSRDEPKTHAHMHMKSGADPVAEAKLEFALAPHLGC